MEYILFKNEIKYLETIFSLIDNDSGNFIFKKIIKQ